jgi:hypothetical protein
MREPTGAEVRRARATIVRELAELGALIDAKIASGQRSASRAGRKSLHEARTAVSQLVARILAEFRLEDALEESERASQLEDRTPWNN